MLDLLLSAKSLPFSIALAVVAGLFLLEIASLLLGGSVMGIGGAEADIDIDADFDVSADVDVDAPGFSLDAVDGADAELTGPSGFLGWTGMQSVPFLIWLVSFLTLFGLSGLVIQSAASGLFDGGFPALIASALALVPALGLTRIIASGISAIMPKTETSATQIRLLGGYRGVISQGTAVRGKPAEAKIKDRHGNTHYLRVEPFEDESVFQQGSDVMIVRKLGDKFFVI
ncbi:YqiJ family protein [Alphaproteobacteria bacterium]|jgi:hypothetical protein|nr:YqiJ family protein [Alphaproteobacteria bacterium]